MLSRQSLSMLIILVVFSGYSSRGHSLSQQLSERQVYERCYAKLVRGTPIDSDPFVAQINAGSKTGVEACKELLRLSVFTPGGLIRSYTSAPEKKDLAVKILSTMTDLHATWFQRKTYFSGSTCKRHTTRSVIDTLEPAYYYSRALFSQSHTIASVLNGSGYIEARREISTPAHSIYARTINSTWQNFPAGVSMIQNGPLLGLISKSTSPQINLRAASLGPGESAPLPVAPNYSFLDNSGGGVLTSQSYLLNNFGDDPELFADVEKMPRIWGKNVFKDFLCRDLPVVQEADITAYIDTSPNSLAFRKQAACVQCHASMDQVIGVVRNFRAGQQPHGCGFSTQQFSMNALIKEAPSLPLGDRWPATKDSNHWKRPAQGKFLFRTYNNVLKNQIVTSPVDLGAKIRSTKDFYICVAKRYYKHFLGVDVDLSPMTSAEVDALPPDRKFFRNRVVNLGGKLKRSTDFNEDPLQLIEAIFELPEYKVRDVTIKAKANQ